MKNKNKKRLKIGLAVLFKIIEVPLILAIISGVIAAIIFGFRFLLDKIPGFGIILGILVITFYIMLIIILIVSATWDVNCKWSSKIIEKIFKKNKS